MQHLLMWNEMRKAVDRRAPHTCATSLVLTRTYPEYSISSLSFLIDFMRTACLTLETHRRYYMTHSRSFLMRKREIRSPVKSDTAMWILFPLCETISCRYSFCCCSFSCCSGNLIKKASGSVVSNRVGMKFARNVLHVNTHPLT